MPTGLTQAYSDRESLSGQTGSGETVVNFDQRGWQFHDNSKVVQVTGDLHLTEQSGLREFTAVLDELRSRILATDGIPAADRTALDAQLTEASAAAQPNADAHADADGAPDDGEPAGEEQETTGDAMAGRLTRIANRLRALGATTAAAAELGTSVDTLAQWAGQHF